MGVRKDSGIKPWNQLEAPACLSESTFSCCSLNDMYTLMCYETSTCRANHYDHRSAFNCVNTRLRLHSTVDGLGAIIVDP